MKCVNAVAPAQRLPGHARLLHIDPNQFIGVQIRRIARQDMKRQPSAGGGDIAFSPLPFCELEARPPPDLPGALRSRIICRSKTTNNVAFSPPEQVQYQNAPLVVTAEAALIDCLWPGR